MKQNHSPKIVAGLAVAALVLTLAATAADAQTGVMFVKNNKVGIGVSDPLVALHVVNPSNPGGDSFAGMGPTPNQAAGSGFNFGYAASVSGGFFNTRSGGLTNLNFATSNVTRMLIDGGNGRIVFGTSVLGVVPAHPLVHNDSGAHLTAAGVWTNASSRELKEGIAELSADDALETLRELNPVTYTYKAEPGEGYVGFIAEDVPELVATGDRKSLASMDVVAVLTKVVQEQQATIDELSRRLEELEGR